MTIKIIKIVFGFLIITSFISEYRNFSNQTGSQSISIFIVCLLFGVFGILLIHSGIKDKPILSYFKIKK
jgi:hypothetical protein